jgi:hypothetical protein
MISMETRLVLSMPYELAGADLKLTEGRKAAATRSQCRMSTNITCLPRRLQATATTMSPMLINLNERQLTRP